MKRRLLWIMVGLLVLLFVIPLHAQDRPVGGFIAEGYTGDDPSAFDPLLSSNPVAEKIQAFIFPNLLGVDPKTAAFAMEQPGALARSWTMSEDGLVYTFILRDDMFWNDGIPITANDVLFTWNAISSDDIQSPLAFVTDTIVDVRAVDDFTVEIEFYARDCEALNDARILRPYPAHVAPEDLSALPDQDFNQSPSVSYDTYNFDRFTVDEGISLIANPTYEDTILNFVNNDGYLALHIDDENPRALVDSFLAGETNVIVEPSEAYRADIYAAEERGEAMIYTYPGNNWEYLAFSLADPDNPRNGLDAEGNLIDQGVHPLFGNSEIGKEVRRALNLALDINAIIEQAAFGEGDRMSAHIVPSAWAFDSDLSLVPYNPELAATLLDEAGWPNSNPNDPESLRICSGCGTTEDGTEFRFTLMTNEDNQRRIAIAEIAEENWAEIGIEVNVQTLEFFTMLEITAAQTWDAYISGWQNDYPERPDARQILTPVGDIVGGGKNYGSYVNQRFTELNTLARTLPGCEIDSRKSFYAEAQRIVQDDTPYIFLFARNGFYAARSEVEGFDPFPNNLWWNIDAWAIVE